LNLRITHLRYNYLVKYVEKTITKFSSFVIFFALVCLIFSGCFSAFPTASENSNSKRVSTDWAPPKVVGRIASAEIYESSGIAASRCQTDVFWTHNDSGDDAFIFAINGRGEKLGTWRVAGAQNIDWEDIAAFKDKNGACFLYIGETGNNRLKRSEFVVYRVREPQISGENRSSSKKDPLATENAEAIRFKYPKELHDAETLMVHPQTGDIYILTKEISEASVVYKLSANYQKEGVNKLEKIADIAVPAVPNGLLTGGDISPDGKSVVICDYFSAYEIVLPGGANNFDEIWKQTPSIVDLGEREQGEAVAYSADGNSIFATSEKKNSPVIEVTRQKPAR
jgi:hypothetical protein